MEDLILQRSRRFIAFATVVRKMQCAKALFVACSRKYPTRGP